MDIVSLLRILLRRWYVLLPLLSLTVGSAVVLSSSIEPEYEANAVVLLIGTTDPSTQIAQNPLEDLRPLNITAQALAIIMSDESVRQNLAGQGFSAAYQVTVRPDTPILSLTTLTGDPEEAVAGRDALIDLLRAALQDQQQSIDAPVERFITAQTISASPGARPIRAARDRALLGVLVLGTLASVAAVVALDQLLQARSRRRKGASAHSPNLSANATPEQPQGQPLRDVPTDAAVTPPFGNGLTGDGVAALGSVDPTPRER